MPSLIVKPHYRNEKPYFLAFAALINAAHSRGLLTYTGIAHLTGLSPVGQSMGKQVGHLIGEISEDEHLAGRPLLSALVVDKIDGMPSFGFFNLARKLGLLKSTSKNAEREFRRKQQTALFECWK